MAIAAVVPALLVSLLVRDAGGALDAAASPLGALPRALVLLPGGSALVHLLALAVLGAAAAGAASELRDRLRPSSAGGPHTAAAVVLVLAAPLLGVSVVDPALAVAVGAPLLAGVAGAQALRGPSRAAAARAAAAVALVVLVLPLGAGAATLTAALQSPSASVWTAGATAVAAALVPVLHGRPRLVAAGTSVCAGAAVLVTALLGGG